MSSKFSSALSTVFENCTVFEQIVNVITEVFPSEALNLVKKTSKENDQRRKSFRVKAAEPRTLRVYSHAKGKIMLKTPLVDV